MNKVFVWVAAILGMGCLYLLGLAFSWIITCGLVYVAYKCFGYEFSWWVATGIWVVIILLKSIFTSSNNK